MPGGQSSSRKSKVPAKRKKPSNLKQDDFGDEMPEGQSSSRKSNVPAKRRKPSLNDDSGEKMSEGQSSSRKSNRIAKRRKSNLKDDSDSGDEMPKGQSSSSKSKVPAKRRKPNLKDDSGDEMPQGQSTSSKSKVPAKRRKPTGDSVVGDVATGPERSCTRGEMKRKSTENKTQKMSPRNRNTRQKNKVGEDKERVPQDTVEAPFHECLLCELKFKERRALGAHIDEMHSVKGRMPSRKPAKLSIKKKAELSSALAKFEKNRSLTTDFDKYRCNLCSTICLDAAALGSHMKRHS